MNSGAFFDTRVASKNAPEFTVRQLGPSTRAVNSGSGNRALVCVIGSVSYEWLTEVIILVMKM